MNVLYEAFDDNPQILKIVKFGDDVPISLEDFIYYKPEAIQYLDKYPSAQTVENILMRNPCLIKHVAKLFRKFKISEDEMCSILFKVVYPMTKGLFEDEGCSFTDDEITFAVKCYLRFGISTLFDECDDNLLIRTAKNIFNMRTTILKSTK